MRQNPVATTVDSKDMLCRSIDFDNEEGFKKDVMHWLLIRQREECFRKQELGATKRDLKKYVIPIY